MKLYTADDGDRRWLVQAKDRVSAKAKWVKSRRGADDGKGLSVRLLRFPRSGVLGTGFIP